MKQVQMKSSEFLVQNTEVLGRKKGQKSEKSHCKDLKFKCKCKKFKSYEARSPTILRCK